MNRTYSSIQWNPSKQRPPRDQTNCSV